LLGDRLPDHDAGQLHALVDDALAFAVGTSGGEAAEVGVLLVELGRDGLGLGPIDVLENQPR